MHIRQQRCSLRYSSQTQLGAALALAILLLPGGSHGQNGAPRTGYDDHQNMVNDRPLKEAAWEIQDS